MSTGGKKPKPSVKHHYLPIFYLSAFARQPNEQRSPTDRARVGQVYQYGRTPIGTIWEKPVHPAGTGYKDHLNTLPGYFGGEGSDLIERKLCEIDDKAKRARDELLSLSPDKRVLDSRHHASWIRFVYSLLERNPEMLSRWDAKGLEIVAASHTRLDGIQRTPEDQDRWQRIKRSMDQFALVKQEVRSTMARRILDPSSIEGLLEYRCEILTLPPGHGYLTSDRPVVLNGGVLSAEGVSMMTMALSPDTLLAIVHPRVTDETVRFTASLHNLLVVAAPPQPRYIYSSLQLGEDTKRLLAVELPPYTPA